MLLFPSFLKRYNFPAVSFAVLIASNAAAQGPKTVDDLVACRQCTVRLQKMMELGSTSDSILLTTLSWFGIDHGGQVYATGTSSRGAIAVYSPQGRFQRLIGRRGQGPGEYVAPVRVVPQESSIHVLDINAARLTVLDQRTFAVKRTVQIPGRGGGQADLLIFADRFVTVAPPARRGGGGSILVFRDAGLVSDSMGRMQPASPSEGGANVIDHVRFLSRSSDSTFWTLRVNKYELEEWSLGGRRLQSIQRRSEWFQPWAAPDLSGSPFRVAQPPLPYGLREDPQGRLWVLVMVPRRDYKPAAAGVNHSLSELPNFYETQLEVIDPNRGVVLVRTRIPGIARFVDGTFAVATYEPRADGTLIWSIFRPEFLSTGG